MQYSRYLHPLLWDESTFVDKKGFLEFEFSSFYTFYILLIYAWMLSQPLNKSLF